MVPKVFASAAAIAALATDLFWVQFILNCSQSRDSDGRSGVKSFAMKIINIVNS